MKLVLLLISLYLVSCDTSVQYVHLSFTTDPSQIMVGWFTNDTTTTSTVNYGLSSSSLNSVAQGSSNYWAVGYGFNHFTLLTNLSPSTTYYYQAGDSTGGWSQIYSFTTQPSNPQPFTVAVYGDMGIANCQNTIMQVQDAASKGKFDWIYHIGDISYADKYVDYQGAWNTFFQQMGSLMPYYPYMVCPGNHEFVSKSTPNLYNLTENFVVYNHRFAMPQANPLSQNMYYSWNYGNAHFISYSTETSYPNSPFSPEDFGDQIDWLINDLQEANTPENRQLRPWIIVMGHRPIYSSCTGFSLNGIPINHKDDNALTLQQTFEDIFFQNGVDLILNGHVHSYERNFPTYDSNVVSGYNNAKAPFNIVIGNGGNEEGLHNEGEKHWTEPEPSWSAYRYGEDYGFALLTFHNNTHMEWNFYLASDGSLGDSVTVTKGV